MLQILLSFGAIDALIPLLVIIIIIAAAAGLTRGYDIFKIFGISTLAGIATTGRGSIAGKSAIKGAGKGATNTFAKTAGSVYSPGKKVRSNIDAKAKAKAAEKAQEDLKNSLKQNAAGVAPVAPKHTTIKWAIGRAVGIAAMPFGPVGMPISRKAHQMANKAAYDQTLTKLRQSGLTDEQKLNLAKKAEKQRENLNIPHPTSIEELNVAKLQSKDLADKAKKRLQGMVNQGYTVGPVYIHEKIGGPLRGDSSKLVETELQYEFRREIKQIRNRARRRGWSAARRDDEINKATEAYTKDLNDYRRNGVLSTNKTATRNWAVNKATLGNVNGMTTVGALASGLSYPSGKRTKLANILELKMSKKRAVGLAAASAVTMGGAYGVHVARRKLHKYQVKRRG